MKYSTAEIQHQTLQCIISIFSVLLIYFERVSGEKSRQEFATGMCKDGRL